MKHYERWKKHGDPHIVKKADIPHRERISRDGVCLVECCGQPRESRGYCERHYFSFRTKGDPLKTRAINKKGTGTTANGYHFTAIKRNGQHRQVGTHRIVMEGYLGRALFPNENVHHINGNRSDNRIENLELWVKSQPSGQRAKDLVLWAYEIISLYGHLFSVDAVFKPLEPMAHETGEARQE